MKDTDMKQFGTKRSQVLFPTVKNGCIFTRSVGYEQRFILLRGGCLNGKDDQKAITADRNRNE